MWNTLNVVVITIRTFSSKKLVKPNDAVVRDFCEGRLQKENRITAVDLDSRFKSQITS